MHDQSAYREDDAEVLSNAATAAVHDRDSARIGRKRSASLDGGHT